MGNDSKDERQGKDVSLGEYESQDRRGGKKRDRASITGDRAAAAVLAFWLRSSEAAGMHNTKDYGEDIIIQPCLNGVIDNSVIFLQVKGTESVRVGPNGEMLPQSVRATYGEIARWLQMGTMSVIVRWAVAEDIGWYAVIHDEFTEEILTPGFRS